MREAGHLRAVLQIIWRRGESCEATALRFSRLPHTELHELLRANSAVPHQRAVASAVNDVDTCKALGRIFKKLHM